MSDTTYNGWSNYATWRVMLEIFDGYDSDGRELSHQECRDYVEEILEMEIPNPSRCLALDYARAFLSDVNWHEIADAVNENNGVGESGEEESD
jgi:hypothetical protein